MAGVFYLPIVGSPTGYLYRLMFYEAGTDVPLDVFTDSDLLVPWAQPIVFNAIGEPDGPIYVDTSPSYKVVYERPAVANIPDDYVAVPGYPVDNVAPSTITTINIMTATVTILTNAQIKALPTTPITLLTAPASGYQNRFHGATLAIDASAGAYTNVDTALASLNIKTGAGAQLALGPQNNSTLTTPLARLTTFLGATDKLVMLNPYSEAVQVSGAGSSGYVQPVVSSSLADYEAEAITISLDNNSAGDLTGGNAANTLRVTIYTTLEQVS